MATRKYEQRVRAKAADETRRRIIDAVYERLRAAPSEPISLDRIARMAEVSRSTIYLIFGSRAGLFDAVATDLLERGAYERVMSAKTHPDARDHLREGIRGGVEMFAADRDVARALFSMAALDPQNVEGRIQQGEQDRARGMKRVAGRLHEQGILRPDVTAKEAADVLWVLTSFDSFDLLYTGRGLDADQVADLLIQTAERALCG